jgi:hypothetical protein
MSNSAGYYKGGCKGINYISATASSTSESSAHPTQTEGCYKQGECMLPYIEQTRYKLSGTGGGLGMTTPSDAMMSTLLTGADETHAGACREIYPFADTITAAFQVQTRIVVAGDATSFDATKKARIQTTVAARLGVAPGRVTIKVNGGSIVLDIVISYPDQAAADAGTTTMAPHMATSSSAAAFLSTPADSISVLNTPAAPVTSKHSATGATLYPSPPLPATPPPITPSSPPPSTPPMGPPPPPPSPNWWAGYDNGALAGIAFAITVASGGTLILIIYFVYSRTRKMSTVKTVPSA